MHVCMYVIVCVPRACVSMFLQFRGARKQLYQFAKEVFVFTEALCSGTGASKTVPRMDLPRDRKTTDNGTSCTREVQMHKRVCMNVM